MSDPISLRSRPYDEGELRPGYRVAEQALRRRQRPSVHLLLFVAVPLLAIGLALSDVKAATPSAGGDLYLGESLLLRGLMWLVLGVLSAISVVLPEGMTELARLPPPSSANTRRSWV